MMGMLLLVAACAHNSTTTQTNTRHVKTQRNFGQDNANQSPQMVGGSGWEHSSGPAQG